MSWKWFGDGRPSEGIVQEDDSGIGFRAGDSRNSTNAQKIRGWKLGIGMSESRG